MIIVVKIRMMIFCFYEYMYLKFSKALCDLCCEHDAMWLLICESHIRGHMASDVLIIKLIHQSVIFYTICTKDWLSMLDTCRPWTILGEK